MQSTVFCAVGLNYFIKHWGEKQSVTCQLLLWIGPAFSQLQCARRPTVYLQNSEAK